MSEELISAPAYIVLNIPSPMAEIIRDLRSKFDAPRAAMPAEITLTGSCGVGLISPGQTLSHVAEEMDRIAHEFAPFEASFYRVERFNNTEIYFLTLEDPSPFEALHRAFAASGIGFQPSAYPYKPHCTLKLRSAPTEQELFELLFMDAPREPFLLSDLSLYSLPDAQSCDLLHATTLCGTRVPR